MSSRAVFSFLGFPGWGPLHLVLYQEGSPAGAALLLSAADQLIAENDQGAGGLLGGVLRSRWMGDPVPSPEWCDDCTYRYLIVFRSDGRWPLRISAWRRSSHDDGWRRRCGPMPLGAFIRRFHPCQRRHSPESADAWRV